MLVAPGLSGFECARCGACCRDVNLVPELARLDRGDGACVHLRGEPGGEHACAAYDERPALCRVDATSDELVEATWRACELLHLRAYGRPLVRLRRKHAPGAS